MRGARAFLLPLVLGACADRSSEPPARNVLLLTLDTTRADALSCYGGPAGATPNLDRLAAESILFERAQSVMPTTQPSHASMMSGLYPPRHTVRDTGTNVFPEAAVTLAERASAAGIRSAAIVAHTVLDASFGLDQGFEHYSAPAQVAGKVYSERSAREIVDEALAWLAERPPAERFFLWAHFYDPHFPYGPSPEHLGPEESRALYQGDVAAMDREIGRLLEFLAERELLASTAVLVVGDHGEAFADHGETMHGIQCYQDTLHVPFLLRRPDRDGAGTRERAIVSVVDVYPTLCEALGLAVEPGLDGLSVWERAIPRGRGAYFESHTAWSTYGWSPIWGWLDESGKLVQDARAQFFDVERDPREAQDLALERPDAVRAAQIAIRSLARNAPLASAETAPAEEMLQALQGLGYLQATGDVESWPPLLDSDGRTGPAGKEALLARMRRATTVLGEGRFDDASTHLRDILEQDPGNYWALEHLALCQQRRGFPERAAGTLEKLVAIGPPRPTWFHALGTNLRESGELERAIEAFRRAAEGSRGSRKGLYLRDLVASLEAAGRGEEAARYRAELEALPGAD